MGWNTYWWGAHIKVHSGERQIATSVTLYHQSHCPEEIDEDFLPQNFSFVGISFQKGDYLKSQPFVKTVFLFTMCKHCESAHHILL